MKNILAENMRRFRTKNLNELYAKVSNSELAAKLEQNPQLTIKFTPPSSGMYKNGADGNPLVIQDPLRDPRNADYMGSPSFFPYNDTDSNYSDSMVTPEELKKFKQALYKIDKQDYIFLLWDVRYSTAFKSQIGANYNTICDYMFSKLPINQRRVGNNPISTVHNYFNDPALGQDLARHLRQFNVDEKELTY